MPLSEKTKSILLAPFAISPILQRFAWPGIAGFLIFGIGLWRQLDWLMVIGAILAAPVIWAYAVLLLVYIPYLLFDSVRRSLKREK
jgi:hypothetical protein